MHNHFKFNDPALQDAVSEVGNKLAGFNERLDAISADIKQLEKWLQDTGFCVYFAIPVYSNNYDEEYLEWQESGKGWRLMYNRIFRDFGGDFDGQELRPLIETKAEVRLRCADTLPEFVKRAATMLSKQESYSSLDEIFEGELPF